MSSKKPTRTASGSSSKTSKPRRATPAEKIPRPLAQPTLDDHLAIMTRGIFQAGLSWAMIAARWDSFRRAFDDFAVAKVAEYDGFDIERLMDTDGIIHSRAKIEGTIHNAQTLLALEREFGGIPGYVAHFADYDALFSDARKRFAHLGDLTCYYWLFRTGQPVPRFETWMQRQPKDHPRMREMVEASRAEGTSSELPR